MDMNRDLDTKDAYDSYLLRVWRFEKEMGTLASKENLWRVSLENTQSRTCVMFTSLDELFYFLKDRFTPKDQIADESKKNLI